MAEFNGKQGVWRTIGGRKVFIADEESLVDAMINSGKFPQLEKNKKKLEPKKLSDDEYQELCNELDDNLTYEERDMLKHYTIGGGYSYYANDTTHQLTMLVENSRGSGVYEEKTLPFGKWINEDIELDKKANFNKEDEYFNRNSFNYQRIMDAKKWFNDMDKIFEEKGVSLDRDIVLYRKGFENAEDLYNSFVRNGYTSTSYKSRINKNTPGKLVLGSNEFEIIVPAGTKMLPIRNVAEEDVKYQNEIILPRNIQYELIDYKTEEPDWVFTKSGNMRWKERKNKFIVKIKK